MSKVHCWIGFIAVVSTAWITTPPGAWAQQEPSKVEQGPAGDSEFLRPGVVIEEVARNSAADQAGIRAGDVLLSWSRGDAKAHMESPFDVSHTEIEQGQVGAVTLSGLRRDEKKTWVVAPDAWGVKTRPNLEGRLLNSYLEGQELAKVGKPAQAVERWRLAEQELRTPWLRSWFLFHIAEFLAEAKQRQEADRAYQEAVDIEGVEPVVTEQILRTWSERLFQRNDTGGAEKRYREALAQSHKLGDESLTMAANLHELGVVFRARYDLKSAQQYFRESLAIKERMAPDSLTLSATLQVLGEVITTVGDLAAAERYFRQGLAIAEKLAPGKELVALHLMRLGIVEGERNNLVEAERYLRRAVVVEQNAAPGSVNYGRILGTLGNVLFERGDLAQAEEYLLKQLSIASQLAPNSPSTAGPLNNLGNVALERGDLVKAEDYYRRALLIYERIDPEGVRHANALNSLGDVFQRRGDFVGAARLYEHALAIRTQQAPGGLEAAESMHSLADAERGLGELTKAEEHYRQALQIRQKLAPGSGFEADTLAALALIIQSKEPDAAAQMFEQSLNALESQYVRLGGSQDTRSGYRAKFDTYYRNYIGLLMLQKQPERAFHVVERSRARSLLEMLVEAHLDIHQGVDPKLLERERTLQSELAAKINRRVSVLAGKHSEDQVTSVTKDIEDVVAKYEEVEGQIRATSPNYAALTQLQPLTLREVQQQLLDKDTLILEYLLGDERSYLFAVTQTSLQVFELPKRADIENTARRVYSLLTQRNRKVAGERAVGRQHRWATAEAAYPEAVAALGQMVLAPVASQLQSKRLLIVADGALQYVPLAILPEPDAGARTPVPLLVHHEIVNLPSASVLAVLRQQEARRQPAPKAVAVLADPVFALSDPRVKRDYQPNNKQAVLRHASNEGHEKKEKDKDAAASDFFDPVARLLTRSATDVGLSQSETLRLPRLPFSRREAEAIMAVTPEGSGMKALDFDANRETATSPQLAQYRVVHFATHGLLDSQHPELSGLVLSLVDREGRHEDGFLQLEDIYNLNLRADLVVLSACETGLGKEVNGEGLIGLTRGFMHAGATRVVSSLWKVDDFATAKLMKAFYTSMERDGKGPAQALREAQLSLINDRRWSSPYYWAGFTIQGEWK